MKKKLIIIPIVLLAVSISVMSLSASALSNPFKDVVKGKYYYDAVIELSSEGIMEGKSATVFGVKQDATREETAYYIAKALDLDLTDIVDPGFKDVSKSSKYYPAIAKLSNLGVIQGDGKGNFLPKNKLQRYQVAILIVKAFELEKSASLHLAFTDVKSYSKSTQLEIQTLVDYKITAGTSKTAFSPKAYVKKEDLALFLKRSIDVYEAFDLVGIE